MSDILFPAANRNFLILQKSPRIVQGTNSCILQGRGECGFSVVELGDGGGVTVPEEGKGTLFSKPFS